MAREPETVGDVLEEQEYAGTQFKRKARLTVPIVSMAHRDVLYCKVISEIYESDIAGLVKDAKNKPEVCNVIDLETGEECLLIVSAIIKSTFAKAKSGYVGHAYEIRSGDIIEGKRYRAIDIYELEI